MLHVCQHIIIISDFDIDLATRQIQENWLVTKQHKLYLMTEDHKELYIKKLFDSKTLEHIARLVKALGSKDAVFGCIVGTVPDDQPDLKEIMIRAFENAFERCQAKRRGWYLR